METQQEPEWLTVAEIAERLKVSQETVRRWVRAGQLPVLDLGGPKMGYRIRKDDLAAFVDARYGPLKNAA